MDMRACRAIVDEENCARLAAKKQQINEEKAAAAGAKCAVSTVEHFRRIYG
jgi:hypothetical protein